MRRRSGEVVKLVTRRLRLSQGGDGLVVEIEAKEEMDIEVEKKWRLTRPSRERREKLRARGVKKCPGPRMNPWIPSTFKAMR